MERFNALGRGAQIMLVGGVLLLIDTFFDWQAISDFPGVSAWDDIGGVIMGLLTIVLVAWIVARLAGVQIPLPVSAAMIGAVLAVLILALAVIKNLQDEFSTFWAWLGLALAIVIAVGAWLEVQAAGGIATLKSQLPSMPASSSGGAAAAAAPPPPAAPEATPSEPEAAADEPSTERET